jgi:hypothetical protein
MSSLYLQSRIVNSPTEPWAGTPSTLSEMMHLIGKVSVSIGAMILHLKILFRCSWGASFIDRFEVEKLMLLEIVNTQRVKLDDIHCCVKNSGKKSNQERCMSM